MFQKKEGEENKTTSDLIFHSSEVEKISSEVDIRARVGRPRLGCSKGALTFPGRNGGTTSCRPRGGCARQHRRARHGTAPPPQA